MSTDLRDKTTKFISKLVQLTRSRELQWQASVEGPTEYPSYEAFIEGSRLRIGRGSWFGPSSGTVSLPKTLLKVTLQVLNPVGLPIYSFEDKAGLDDLYEAAAYSASNIDELVDAVLERY